MYCTSVHVIRIFFQFFYNLFIIVDIWPVLIFGGLLSVACLLWCQCCHIIILLWLHWTKEEKKLKLFGLKYPGNVQIFKVMVLSWTQGLEIESGLVYCKTADTFHCLIHSDPIETLFMSLSWLALDPLLVSVFNLTFSLRSWPGLGLKWASLNYSAMLVQSQIFSFRDSYLDVWEC